MEKISKAQVKLIKSLQLKKYRDELGLFVAEGEKCVEELRKAFELVLLVRDTENASRTEIEQMSSLHTPQGVIAVFRQQPAACIQRSALVLVLDGIQDPGNLGTIIRTCDWFGVHDIVCSHDTADCYNPKVVQATMGALARVRIHYTDIYHWINEIKNREPKTPVYGTLLDGKNMYDVLKKTPPTNADQVLSQQSNPNYLTNVIIMGNEGNGIRPNIRTLVTQPIRIPPFPKNAETSESLNVAIATAIILAEFRRPK